MGMGNKELKNANIHYGYVYNDSTKPEVTYLIGNANADGKLNVKDATTVQKFVAGMPVGTPLGEEVKNN